MEDDKIRDLFTDFDPELTDTSGFMERVTRGLDAVEVVRERQAVMRRRQRRALGVAAFIGVFVGIGLTMLYMLVVDSIAALHLPDVTWIVRNFGLPVEARDIAVDLRIPTLLLFAAAATLTAVNAYSFSMAWAGRSHRDSER